MLSRLRRFPAYVSLSRFTIAADSSCICCKMKLDPIKPAPPVTRIVFCMRNMAGFRTVGYAARRHLIVIKKDGVRPAVRTMLLFTTALREAGIASMLAGSFASVFRFNERASQIITGRLFRPLNPKVEAHSGLGPASFIFGKRCTRLRIAICPSNLASWAPMQKCKPAPNARC